jgi:hypothetical protein
MIVVTHASRPASLPRRMGHMRTDPGADCVSAGCAAVCLGSGFVPPTWRTRKASSGPRPRPWRLGAGARYGSKVILMFACPTNVESAFTLTPAAIINAA